MKATGLAQRSGGLRRVAIGEQIRHRQRRCEGDPSQMTLETWQQFSFSMLDLAKRMGLE